MSRATWAEKSLGAGLVTDLTKRFRGIEHLPSTWLFARFPRTLVCLDDVIHTVGLLRVVCVAGHRVHSSCPEEERLYNTREASARRPRKTVNAEGRHSAVFVGSGRASWKQHLSQNLMEGRRWGSRERQNPCKSSGDRFAE